jgi:FixJ family two-component response regulator
VIGPICRELPMMEKRPLVSVVDDDQSVREALPELLCALGYPTRAFASAEAFLASEALDETRCLVLDVALEGMSGPELHAELARRCRPVATVFITARGDEATCRALLAAGAVACLRKPFSESALIEALDAALRTEWP